MTNKPDVKSDGSVPHTSAAPLRRSSPTGGVLGPARIMIAVCGIVAGLAAFGIGEATAELIPPDKVQFDFFGNAREQITRDTPRAITRSAALAFGILGLCLGAVLGIAGGLARRSVAAATTAGLLGAILGGMLGAGATFGLLRRSIAMRSQYPNNDLVIGILVHGVIWGAMGAAAGLAFAVGLGDRRLIGRAIAFGFAGAVAGALAFDLIGAFAFPLARTDFPISLTGTSRLLARLLVGFGTAAVIAWLMPAPRPADEGSPEPAVTATTQSRP